MDILHLGIKFNFIIYFISLIAAVVLFGSAWHKHIPTDVELDEHDNVTHFKVPPINISI